MPPTEGKVDVHPTLNALVVSYDVETVLLSEYGEPMAADVKECRKVYVQHYSSPSFLLLPPLN